MRLPKEPGALIDLGRRLEEERREFQQQVEEKIAKMKEQEAAVEAALIAYCEDNKVGKISGRNATATFNKTPLPSVKDWDAFYAHIRKTGDFSLLEKRPGRLAYKERLEAGEKVPGVETYWKKSISYSKFNGKG